MKVKAGMNGYPKISCTRTVEKKGNTIRTRIEMRYADGSSAGSISYTRSAPKKLKKLQYNFKDISTRIMQARTSGSAGRVLTSARARVAMLKGKLQGGEYDDRELRAAITHAEAIASVAKKRMKHLREEENAKRQGGPCEAEQEDKRENEEVEELVAGGNTENPEKEDVRKLKREYQKLKREYQKLMRDAQKELEDSLKETEDLEDLSEAVGSVAADDMDPADLELMKKKHRAKEMREIMEADMKYLKALFDQLAKEKQELASGGTGSIGDGSASYTSDSGVALEIGGADIPVQMPAADAAALVEGGTIDASV
ncbi:MAG: hypothetical protein K2P59_07995 [Acetatifactor sp.]|nr:hypothetical protein [Acetatifactor sp.]